MAPGLVPPLLRHADDSFACHEPVVQNADLDALQDLGQPFGNELVRVAELPILTRMIVQKQASRRLLGQNQLHDFAAGTP